MPKKPLLAALGVVVLVVPTACSSDSGGGSGSPQHGGTLIIGDEDDGPSLDPHKDVVYRVHENISATYSKLIDYKTGPDTEYDSFEITPDLAEDWEVSDDNLTYTFHLRDDVTWHDVPPVNGREFTSDDVVATMERIQEMGHQDYLLEQVESIDAPDDHTVVFTLSEPFAPFLGNMAHNYMWILPREGVEGEFDLATKAIGTGPFILESWERGESMVRKANPDYFVEGRPYLDEIQTIRVPQQGSRLSSFNTGELHILNELGASDADLENIEKNNPDVDISGDIGLSRTVVNMRGDDEPFDDVRVRRAVAMAVNREEMGETLRAGSGASMTGPLSPAMDQAFTPEEAVESTPYDPDEAKKLLAEAGYEDGFETTMSISEGYGEVYMNEAQWIQQDLADVGIEVELIEHDWATFTSEILKNRDFDMSLGVRSPLLEANEVLTSEYHTDGRQNYSSNGTDELDEMIEEQRSILDEDERTEKIHEIQEYIEEEVANPAMMYSYHAQRIVQPEVQDYYPHISRSGRPLMDVWLDE